jgi:short subunit dehydrogenase
LSAEDACPDVGCENSSNWAHEEADWDFVHSINLKASCFCAQATARAMVAAGTHGAIVSLASAAVFGGSPRGVHYAASKGGIVSLTRAMATEFAPYRIRVNAIAPGLTDTAQPRYGATEEELMARALRHDDCNVCGDRHYQPWLTEELDGEGNLVATEGHSGADKEPFEKGYRDGSECEDLEAKKLGADEMFDACRIVWHELIKASPHTARHFGDAVLDEKIQEYDEELTGFSSLGRTGKACYLH